MGTSKKCNPSTLHRTKSHKHEPTKKPEKPEPSKLKTKSKRESRHGGNKESKDAAKPSDESRYEPNPFRKKHVPLPSQPRAEWVTAAERTMAFVCHTYPASSLLKNDNYTLYTGSAGVAYACWRLYRVHKQPHWLTHAFDYLECALQQWQRRAPTLADDKRASFLCGPAGVHALAAVLYAARNDARRSEHAIQDLLDAKPTRSTPCEMLYGRAGYLHALLWVHSEVKGSSSKVQKRVQEAAVQVVRDTVQIGKAYSQSHSYHELGAPLMYEWHKSPYIGAAHGLAGVIYQLLNARDVLPGVKRDVSPRTLRACIRWLADTALPSGNFPSQTGSQSDKLVQWCHGATGMALLLARAHRVFRRKFMYRAAVAAGNVVWRRGLLSKGPGCCHGWAGGIYAFLALYRMTRQSVWLERASAFGWYSLCQAPRDVSSLSLPGQHQTTDRQLWFRPDEPYSLFNGMAGAAVAFLDMASPENGGFFPCFDTF